MLTDFIFLTFCHQLFYSYYSYYHLILSFLSSLLFIIIIINSIVFFPIVHLNIFGYLRFETKLNYLLS